MKINAIKRPWETTSQRRYNPDPRYQSGSWQKARKVHKAGSTKVTPQEWENILEINPGLSYMNATISNTFCIDCFKEGKLKPMTTVDHNVRVKDGADFYDHSNYRSLCTHHHAVKSAKEAQL